MASAMRGLESLMTYEQAPPQYCVWRVWLVKRDLGLASLRPARKILKDFGGYGCVGLAYAQARLRHAAERMQSKRAILRGQDICPLRAFSRPAYQQL